MDNQRTYLLKLERKLDETEQITRQHLAGSEQSKVNGLAHRHLAISNNLHGLATFMKQQYIARQDFSRLIIRADRTLPLSTMMNPPYSEHTDLPD